MNGKTLTAEQCSKLSLYILGGRERLGCWFCHNQRVGELKRLYYDYPELWDKLAKLDRDSPVTFKPGKTLADFGRRFSLEGMQEKLF